MPRQTVLVANLILVSLIAFSACEPSREIEKISPAADDLELDPHCVGKPINYHFKDDCNSCTCFAPGIAGCTEKLCAPAVQIGSQPKLSKRSPQEAALSPDPRCAGKPEGFQFKNDCNTCTCSATGLAGCTRKSCEPTAQTGSKRKLSKRQAASNTDPRCEGKAEGFEFKEDCNSCTCLASGISSCTRKGCPPTPFAGSLGCFGKPAGFEFKADCNLCTCSAEGLAGCTRRFCPEVPKNGLDKVCNLDGNHTVSWKDDCNNCVCVAKGVPACTRMLCPPKPTPADTGVDIVAGMVKPKPTPADAGVDLVAGFLKPQNRINLPGSAADPRCNSVTGTFEDDCNTCWCMPDGAPACTLMACPTEKVKRDTQKLIKAFAAGKQGHETHLPLMSAASGDYPGVWTATAILSVVTAVLARI